MLPVALPQFVDLVPARQAETTHAARVLLGKKTLVFARTPEGVPPAHVDPPARQRRSGEHRPEIDLSEYHAAGSVEGHQLAAADGGKIGHTVPNRDPRTDDVPDVAVHRLAGRASHFGYPAAFEAPMFRD